MSTTTLLAPAGSAGTLVQTAYGNATVGSDLTVTVDSRAVSSLLGAGYQMTTDDLPVGESLKSGSHTTTSDEASANTLTIATGLTSITAAIVQVLDSGNNVVTADADVTFSGGNIVVADGATYNTVAGQIIKWIATGVA